jgi:hypothetical protein
MGSAEAASIIHERGDDQYEGYDSQITKLREAYSKGSADAADLYLGRLRAAREALAAPAAGAPAYMSLKPWRRKQLLTALGAWTELKHDTILYTKQPYTMTQAGFAVASKGGPRPPPPPPVHGYVEPSPQVFATLRSLVNELAQQIQRLGFPADAALRWNVESFAGLMGCLEEIAQAELAGRTLREDQQKTIEHIGERLAGVLRFAHYLDVTEKFRSAMDHDMPIVADVHTDANTESVLEEGVGPPMIIYAVAPVDGKPTVCRGVVYSQCEFKQPMSRRLTDEQWRQTLREGKEPTLAEWTRSFIASAGDH